MTLRAAVASAATNARRTTVTVGPAKSSDLATTAAAGFKPTAAFATAAGSDENPVTQVIAARSHVGSTATTIAGAAPCPSWSRVSTAVETAHYAVCFTADKNVQYLTGTNANDSVDTTTAAKRVAAPSRPAHYDADLPDALWNQERLLMARVVKRLGTLRYMVTRRYTTRPSYRDR